MSRMLNLVEHLLARGRNLHKLGIEKEALQTFSQLSRLGELEPEVAEEVQSRLAEMLLRRGKYRRARRHLSAALAHHPNNAHYHHLMATALDADMDAEPGRALDHWRQALRLNPTQPRYLADFGLLAVLEGHEEEGLAALRQAHQLAADDPTVLAKVCEGFCHVGQIEEARTLLRTALFRNPRNVAVRQLWNDFQFQQLRVHQEAARHCCSTETIEEEPVVLPFVRPPSGTQVGNRIVRRDRATGRPAPHSGNWVPEKKHA